MGAVSGRFGRAHAKSQIALEFMIVYSIILVVFVIMFALIASERSVALAQQQSTLMQLIAQNVAGYINQALQAGNGYTITAPLSAGIGYIPYNLSISTTGLVFANTTVGQEIVLGEASSSARNLAINGTLVSSGNGISLYVLPIYSGYLTISNAGGIIYIDNPSLGLPPLASNLSLTQQASLNAPHFTPASDSFVLVANAPSLRVPTSITLDAWIYMSAIDVGSGSQVYISNPIVGEYGHNAQPFMLAVSNYGQPSFEANDGGKGLQGSTALSANVLYNIAATYNSSTSKATLYINGNPIASNTLAIGGFQGQSNLTIGGAPNSGTYFNGYISDVQVYNTSLSPQQIEELYAGGPSSSPTNLVSRIVGWWPLNGNFNDYSGNANAGTPYNAPLTPVIALQAKVNSFGGYPLSGVPIGFWSTNSLLGGSNSISTKTGSNGGQGTLLISNGIYGRNQAQSIYFNGNLTAQYKLVGWWPLNIGDTGTAYNYAGNYLSGTFNGGYGFLPNVSATLTSQFNGGSSLISVANAPTLNPANVTIAAWFNPTTSDSSARIIAKPNTAGTGDDYDLYSGASGCAFGIGSRFTTPASGTNFYQFTPSSCSSDAWYFGASTYQSATNTISLYINGQLVGTSSNTVSGPLSSSAGAVTLGYSSFGSHYWAGNISNVQLYNTTLSAAQINTLYLQGITGTPIPGRGLIGWWPLTGNDSNYAALQTPYATTSSNVAYNSVVYSTTYPAQNTTQVPLFNGVNTLVTIGSGALPSATLCNFTIAAWVYNEGTPSNSMAGVFNFSRTSPQNSYFTGVYINNTAVKYGAFQATVPDFWTASSSYSLKNGWTFVAIRRNNGGTGYGFLNGQQVGQVQPGLSCLMDPPYSAKIGYSGATHGYLNGSVVDVQFYNTSLTNAQILQLYQQGFPAPTTANVSIG